jgi:hypothetical protein
MKKVVIGFITCLVFSIPILTLSAPNLAERLKGRILLAVEDRGKTYFVYEDGNRYLITKQTAQKVFEKLALGITNEDLEKIPINDVGVETEIQVAECLPKVVERLTYIDRPGECDYKKYTDEIQTLRKENENLNNQISGNNINTPVCTSWTYSDWSACSSAGIKTRTILSSDSNNCVGGSPVLEQGCLYEPSIEYSDYNFTYRKEYNWKGLKIYFTNPTSRYIKITRLEVTESTPRDNLFPWIDYKFAYMTSIRKTMEKIDSLNYQYVSSEGIPIMLGAPNDNYLQIEAGYEAGLDADLTTWSIWDDSTNKPVLIK